MKFNEKILLTLAIMCFTAVLGYANYTFARSLANSQCVQLRPGGGGGSCDEVGGRQCDAGASDCYFCNVESAIPNFSCVPMEGSTCDQSGGAAYFCVGGTEISGYCTGGSCVVVESGAPCGDSSGPYFPCS